MPILNSTTIATKLRGVTREGRQTIINAMYEQPELVKLVYRDNMTINFILEGFPQHAYCLGYLDNKYISVLHNKITKVKSWQITGGYRLNDPEYKNLKATYGINLTIEIVGDQVLE